MIFRATAVAWSGRLCTPQSFHFGEFTLHPSRYLLQHGDRTLRLERRPMEFLILLVEKRGELVSREEVARRLWGTDVFVDVDHGINTAVRKIRIALHDDPDKPRFVETVIGKGYRFSSQVEVNGDTTRPPTAGLTASPQPVQSAPSAAIAAAPALQRHRRPSLLMLLAGTAAVLAVIASSWVAIHVRSVPSAIQPHVRSLAVLPLKNLSGDPGQEYLADGMTEALVSRLSGIHDLRVISRTSSMRFKNSELSVPEIAKALQVDAVVEGSVIREGNRIRVTAQLIRGTTDEHFWSETYDREVPDVLALQSDVAQAIARKVEVTVNGKEQQRLTASHAVVPEAYESYLKGSFSLSNSNTRAGVEKSIDYFEDAIRKDPAFAQAYLGLAEAHLQLSSIVTGGLPPQVERPKMESAARKALELDPNLDEAHVLLADVAQKQWRWTEAESEYRWALELSPNNSDAYAGLGGWLVCQGRLDEAVASVQHARELDSVGSATWELGWVLFQSRRYDEAVRELRATLTVRQDDASLLWMLGFVLAIKGQPSDAIPILEKAADLSGGSSGKLDVLTFAYARAGQREHALRLLAELKRREQVDYVPAASFVIAYIGLSDYEPAFAWLEQAYQEHSAIMQFLKVHPLFDPIRNDPRFVHLVSRVGLQ
ncbi:MAG TPA: winged helix-turn-helix domain-containing protein [Candidatus Sulfotelmatobacter sp.]